MIPNLIIPGAQKSGTSSLYNYLKVHPECIMSEPKEPSFFSKRANLDKTEGYMRCFSDVVKREKNPKIFGEATTAYMVEDDIPERIKSILGTCLKFIFVLRNPVERAISAYWHLFKRYDEIRSIEEVFRFDTDNADEVIEQEAERIQAALKQGRIRIERYKPRYDDYTWPFRYVRNSCYYEHLSRFAAHFDRKNMLFTFTEHLAKGPEEVFRQVERFLGIDDTFMPDTVGKRYNKTFVPRRGRLFRWVYSVGNSPFFSKCLAKYGLVDKIHMRVVVQEKPETDRGIKEELRLIFAGQEGMLSEFLNVDVSMWWG